MSSFLASQKMTNEREVQSEYNHFNPVNKHLKKPRHSKNNHTPHQNNHPYHPQTDKQFRFKHLSKEKNHQYFYSQLQQYNKENQHTQGIQLVRVRRKLQFEKNHSNSRENSLTFSDVIRMSREKKLREESAYKPNNKIIKDNHKKSTKKVFNELKNRLIGQQSQSNALAKPQKYKEEQCKQIVDMVRVSTQFEPNLLSESLSMAPF